MTTVLVTGGAGFIGSNLVNHLVDNKILDVYWFDRDYSKLDQNQAKNYIELDIKNIEHITSKHNIKPDIIYHLAADIRVQESFGNPTQYIENNVLGTQYVLDYAHKIGAKVIYAGSPSRHGDPASSPYALSKYLGEELCKMYRKVYKLDVNIARFYNVYGPNEHVGPKDASVIGIWRYNVKNNIKCQIVGDGDQERDFIHVQDIVEGLVAISKSPTYHEDAWELGTGSTTSINDLATMFHERFNTHFDWVEDQKGNVKKSILINNDTTTRLGWNPQRELVHYIMTL